MAAIAVPRFLTFAPIDLERESLVAGLTAVGFDPRQQTFFTWLGVVPYLPEQAVYSTLSFIASVSAGAHVVFDYANPRTTKTNSDLFGAPLSLAARVASLGEPLRSYFETDVLDVRLTALGFPEIEDLGPSLIRERYFMNRGGSLPDRGGHIVHATRG